jgi:hypothetical protein
MTAFELIDTLQRQGFILTPLPEGKLAVSPADRITEELRHHIRLCKAEVVALLTRPHIDAHGELIIPFNSDPRYHYWKRGSQSIGKTLAELDAPPDVWRRYVGSYSDTRQ